MYLTGTSSFFMHVVYVYAFKGGTNSLRPVLAEKVGYDAYKLLSPDEYDPENEKWDFVPGTMVIVKRETSESSIGEPISKLIAFDYYLPPPDLNKLTREAEIRHSNLSKK